MLTALGRLPRGARFRRLAQELEAHAAAQAGPVVWQMARWCAPRPRPPRLVARALARPRAAARAGALSAWRGCAAAAARRAGDAA